MVLRCEQCGVVSDAVGDSGADYFFFAPDGAACCRACYELVASGCYYDVTVVVEESHDAVD